MKDWIRKIVQQFEVDSKKTDASEKISEELATILFLIDVYNKNLWDTPKFSVRQAREELDQFSKKLIQTETQTEDKEELFFHLRQFFNSHRIDETTYFLQAFEDFKNIIWGFADQLKEEVKDQKNNDQYIDGHFKELRDAVESNSLEKLREKSKEFIAKYVEVQNRRETSKQKRMNSIKKNLNTFKKKLSEAQHTMNHDFLTGAFNRRYFEEQVKEFSTIADLGDAKSVMMILDIDHFKKINDSYGHDVGDFVLKECVATIKKLFPRESDTVARLGGEEFSIFLPDYTLENAVKKADEVLETIRKQVFVHGSHQINFTVSIGLSDWRSTDQLETIYKRCDQALYEAKMSGRNRCVVADKLKAVA
ncbi:MAG: diguanylate cyclase [Bdellovibrionaceae bacterium]|nr:diguanylate cyclase [Pseudobdellovibrionaceae bacterium]